MVTSRRPNRYHYKRISKGARNATVGSHVSKSSVLDSGRKGPSNARSIKNVAGRPDEINQVLPSTSTRESHKEYKGRISRREYGERLAKETRRRGILIAAAIVVLGLILAALVACATYVVSTNSKIEIKDDVFQQALADAPESENGIQWALLSASFGSDGQPLGADVIFAVRMDTINKTTMVLTIPGNTYIKSKDGTGGSLGDILQNEGEAAFLSAVEQFTGIQFNYYVHIGQDALVRLVDEMGGLPITIPEEVDDPSAGSFFLSAGDQVLTGEETVFYCRAKNYVGGQETRAMNITQVMYALVRKAGSAGLFEAVSYVDVVSDDFRIDEGVPHVFKAFKSAASYEVLDDEQIGLMPGSVQKIDNVSYVVPRTEEWMDMVSRVSAGELPYVDTDAIIESIDKESFTITVNNGSGITGAAGEAEKILTDAGFKVETVGNASASVYEETLIVYKDASYSEEAEAVVATLGIGRPVHNDVHYDFDTDVLVVIGTDWIAD